MRNHRDVADPGRPMERNKGWTLLHYQQEHFPGRKEIIIDDGSGGPHYIARHMGLINNCSGGIQITEFLAKGNGMYV